jgi:hypothetical protein
MAAAMAAMAAITAGITAGSNPVNFSSLISWRIVSEKNAARLTRPRAAKKQQFRP